MSVFHKRSSLLMQNTWQMTFLGKKIVVFSGIILYISKSGKRELLVLGTKHNIRDYESDKPEFEFHLYHFLVVSDRRVAISSLSLGFSHLRSAHPHYVTFDNAYKAILHNIKWVRGAKQKNNALNLKMLWVNSMFVWDTVTSSGQIGLRKKMFFHGEMQSIPTGTQSIPLASVASFSNQPD